MGARRSCQLHSETCTHTHGAFGKTSLIAVRRSVGCTCTHQRATYPVVEAGRPVRPPGEVVDSVVASVAGVQEQSHILYVVLYGRLHPLGWVGHDCSHEGGQRFMFHRGRIVVSRGTGGRRPTCYSGRDVGNIQIPFGIAGKVKVSGINLKVERPLKIVG